jgi:hypothetical protein
VKKLAFLLLAGALPLQAADQTITFAVPEVDGSISLGVYDANKKLVRTIATNVTDKDPAFKIGLNGFITVWDGKNDAGEALPAGKYDVKGYVVADSVKAEGEAFHFNDWVVDEDSPRLANPRVIWAKGPEVYLAGDGVVAKSSEKGGLDLVKEVPPSARFLACDGQTAYFQEDTGAVHALVLATGELSLVNKDAVPADNVFLARALQTPQVMTMQFPPKLWLYDQSPTLGLITSDGKTISLRGQEVPVGENLLITSISAGVGETFWVVGQTLTGADAGPAFVRQYSTTGEVLRQIAGDFPATNIFADKTENRIYLTHLEGATTTIKGLRPVEAKTDAAPAATATPPPVDKATEAPKQADWEVFLEKISTLCPKFGLVEGKLVADAGSAEQKTSHRFDLPPSTMDQQQHTLTVHLKAKDGEIWATGTGGLKLTLVGKLPGVDRVVVAPGEKKGQLKVYAGNGVVVAEYLLSGLDEIAQINAGEIELP